MAQQIVERRFPWVFGPEPVPIISCGMPAQLESVAFPIHKLGIIVATPALECPSQILVCHTGGASRALMQGA